MSTKIAVSVPQDQAPRAVICILSDNQTPVIVKAGESVEMLVHAHNVISVVESAEEYLTDHQPSIEGLEPIADATASPDTQTSGE